MNRATIIRATAGYVAGVALLLGILFWFLRHEGFSEVTFLVGSVSVLFLGVAIGYVIASFLIEAHTQSQARLQHTIDETLHELKIPLSTVELNAEMLYQSLDDAKDRRRLERISEAIKRLERLYKNLSYALKKQIAPPPKETFDIAVLLRERKAYFESLGITHPITIEAHSCLITGDKIGFEQMVDNLLSNAIKYSLPQSEIVVRFKPFLLEIIDQGKGMDEVELMSAFERYYRGESDTKGEGLGLMMVKRFCDENGYQITIHSSKGGGTLVKVVLKNT